jgi:CubicO group peptidase (beta-lactamase class C family)
MRHRSLPIRSRTLALAAPLALAVATPDELRAQPDAAEARRAMTAAVDRAAAAGFVGHVLAVRAGQPFFEASRGLATRPEGTRASGTPVDSATVFSIGSVTKQFTRAAILRLEEEGKLATDDPISRYVPGLPEDKRGITLRQLLDMRAGLHAYHDTRNDTTPGDHQRVSKEEALRRIGAQRLLFAPGTQREYSNSGYTLLAAVVERVTGRPFPEYVRAALVEPAGMTATGFYGDDRWPDRGVARGRGERSFGAVNAPHRWPPPSWVLMGAGGMVSNARDLHRWVAALRGGRILGAAALAKFYPRDPAVYAGGNDFGFGALVLELDGGRDVVLVTTSAGARRMRLGVELAEAMRGRPLPDEIRRMFGGEREVAQDGPDQQVVRRGAMPDTPPSRAARAFLRALEDGSTAALTRVVNELFADRVRAAYPLATHLEMLGGVSASLQSASNVTIAPRGPTEFEIRAGGSDRTTVVVLRVQAEAPHRIESLTVDRR